MCFQAEDGFQLWDHPLPKPNQLLVSWKHSSKRETIFKRAETFMLFCEGTIVFRFMHIHEITVQTGIPDGFYQWSCPAIRDSACRRLFVTILECRIMQTRRYVPLIPLSLEANCHLDVFHGQDSLSGVGMSLFWQIQFRMLSRFVLCCWAVVFSFSWGIFVHSTKQLCQVVLLACVGKMCGERDATTRGESEIPHSR